MVVSALSVAYFHKCVLLTARDKLFYMEDFISFCKSIALIRSM